MRNHALNDRRSIDRARLVIILAMTFLLGVTEVTAGDKVSHGTYIWLRTRKHRYLNTDHGKGPAVKVIPEPINTDPNISDEIWTIELANGDGQIRNGDRVFLRTRKNHYLTCDGGTGPVKVTTIHSSDPKISDELWVVERLAGNGDLVGRDQIFLKTRAGRYLNTDNGVGPGVKVVNNASPDPDQSDELWIVGVD